MNVVSKLVVFCVVCFSFHQTLLASESKNTEITGLFRVTWLLGQDQPAELPNANASGISRLFTSQEEEVASFGSRGEALEQAAREGNLEKVNALINDNPELITKKWIQTVSILVSEVRRTDVEYETTFGDIALLAAVQHGHLDIAHLLVAAGTQHNLNEFTTAISTAREALGGVFHDESQE